MTPEEFDSQRSDKRSQLLSRWQDAKRWGGNAVPRAEIRPSYRIAIEQPLGMPISSKEADTVIQSYGPDVSRGTYESLIEDLRYRGKGGSPESILTPIED